MQPLDSRFQVYVEMDKSGAKFDFPLSEEVLMLNQLSDKMTKLKSTELDTDNFFDKAITIGTSLAPLEGKVNAVYINLSDAVNALHIEKIYKEYYRNYSFSIK